MPLPALTQLSRHHTDQSRNAHRWPIACVRKSMLLQAHALSNHRHFLATRLVALSTMEHTSRLFVCIHDIHMQAIANQHLGTETVSLKSFLCDFPKLTKSATKADIFNFLSGVTCCCMGCSFHVPPQHTMVATHSQGKWAPYLPHHSINQW